MWQRAQIALVKKGEMYFERIFQMKEGYKVCKNINVCKFLGHRYSFGILHTTYTVKTGKNVVTSGYF